MLEMESLSPLQITSKLYLVCYPTCPLHILVVWLLAKNFPTGLESGASSYLPIQLLLPPGEVQRMGKTKYFVIHPTAAAPSPLSRIPGVLQLGREKYLEFSTLQILDVE